MPSRYRMPPASRIISCSAPLRATSATNKMRHRLPLQDRARPDGRAVLLTYCQKSGLSHSIKGMSGNLRVSEQWAGHVCSVSCQVHTNILVAVKTGPICAQAMRGSGGPFPWVSAQTERVQDWPSQNLTPTTGPLSDATVVVP
jgi:hypothetical protein